jgi:hypothetical protein
MPSIPVALPRPEVSELTSKVTVTPAVPVVVASS